MKQATKRLASFAIGLIFVFGALIVFFNFVQPAYNAAQILKSEKLSRENLYATQQATQKQVDNIIKSYQGSSNPQALANLSFPPAKDEADVVEQINTLANTYKVAVQNITISSPGAKSLSTTGRGAATSTLVKPIGVLNVQLRVASSYAGFRSFLSSLEYNIRIMDITSLAVSPVGKSNQDYYTFDIGLAAYYQNP